MLVDVAFERLDGIDVTRNSRVVFHKRIFARSKPELAFTSFESMEIFDDAVVVLHEIERPCHLAHHHGFAPENLGAVFGIHAGVIHTMATANHKPSKAHFFDGFDKAAFLVPCRLKPATRAERFCHLQNPFRLDFGSLREERAARFAHFGTEKPFHALGVQIAAREHMRFATAHQAVTAIFDIAVRNPAQESGEERNVQIVAMERIERTNFIFKFHFENAAELFVQIHPFTQAQKVHAVLIAELAEFVPSFAVPVRAERIPHRNVNEEVALVTAEFAVQLTNASTFRFIVRHHTRILDAKSRAHDKRRLQNAQVTSTQKHRRKRHVHREARHIAAKLGHMTARIVSRECAKFKQRLVSATECRMRRRLQEREVFEFQPETAQLQNDICQIATANFWLREFIALFKILGRVKANAHAGLHAPRASSALPRAGLRNFFDGKPLDSRLRIVARDSGHTRIDNVSNSRNRKRCFSNVRCQDHASLARMLENAALLIRAHTPVKREHVKSRCI